MTSYITGPCGNAETWHSIAYHCIKSSYIRKSMNFITCSTELLAGSHLYSLLFLFPKFNLVICNKKRIFLSQGQKRSNVIPTHQLVVLKPRMSFLPTASKPLFLYIFITSIPLIICQIWKTIKERILFWLISQEQKRSKYFRYTSV